MTLTEAGKLLALISEYDNRHITAETSAAWFDLLHRYTLAEAKHAVKKHFDESPDWLMPAHITRIIRAERKARLARAGTITTCRADMTGAGSELATQRELIQAVASGAISVDQYQLYRDGETPWREYQRHVLALEAGA